MLCNFRVKFHLILYFNGSGLTGQGAGLPHRKFWPRDQDPWSCKLTERNYVDDRTLHDIVTGIIVERVWWGRLKVRRQENPRKVQSKVVRGSETRDRHGSRFLETQRESTNSSSDQPNKELRVVTRRVVAQIMSKEMFYNLFNKLTAQIKANS